MALLLLFGQVVQIWTGAVTESMQARVPASWSLRTSDPEQLAENVVPMAGEVRIASLDRRMARAELRAHLFGSIALFRPTLSPMQVVQDAGRDWHGLTIPLGGSFEVHGFKGARVFESGTAHLLDLNDDFDLRLPRGGCLLVANFLGESLSRNLSGLRTSDGDRPPRLSSTVSLQTRAGSALYRYLIYLWGELEHGGGALTSPVVRREMEDALLLLMSSATGDGHTRDVQRRPLGRNHLARAEEYLAAHLTDPVSSADLAAVSGVSYRTLSRAFRRAHGVTPMAFVRALRLEAVHRELLGSRSPDVTVTEVAFRYGFGNLGRFAGEYQRAFAEKPSETLRR